MPLPRLPFLVKAVKATSLTMRVEATDHRSVVSIVSHCEGWTISGIRAEDIWRMVCAEGQGRDQCSDHPR